MNAVAHQLDEQTARELALSQLDRARAARAAERQHRAIEQLRTDDHQGESELLAAFGTSRDQLLGSGGESEVFAIDHERVLRLYRSRHEAPRRTAVQLQTLYQSWAGCDIGLELPLILESGERNGRFFTVDRRLSGRNFSGWLQHADMSQRRPALISFLDATERPPPAEPGAGFARLIGEDAPQQFGSLVELLSSMLRDRCRPAVLSWNATSRTSPRFGTGCMASLRSDRSYPRWCTATSARAYLSQGPEGPVVTGIADFSPHGARRPVAGCRWRVDLPRARAAAMMAADTAWLEAVAVERHGREIVRWIDVYRQFYGFYFSNAYAFDPTFMHGVSASSIAEA